VHSHCFYRDHRLQDYSLLLTRALTTSKTMKDSLNSVWEPAGSKLEANNTIPLEILSGPTITTSARPDLTRACYYVAKTRPRCAGERDENFRLLASGRPSEWRSSA